MSMHDIGVLGFALGAFLMGVAVGIAIQAVFGATKRQDGTPAES